MQGLDTILALTTTATIAMTKNVSINLTGVIQCGGIAHYGKVVIDMRLIDADALMEILTTAIRNMKDMAKFLDAEGDPEIQMEIKAYTDIANGVKGMPTIEPERKTGKWIHDGFDHPHGVDWIHCSLCGRREPNVPAAKTPYCPSCGADMRGEGEQE